MRTVTALLALTSAGCSQIAMGSTITEFSRTAFQTALSSSTLSGQDFDSLPIGTIATVNGVTYTPSSGAAVVTNHFRTSTPPNGLGSTSFGFFGLGPDETLTILFPSAITAFALDINTFATNSGDYEATYTVDTLVYGDAAALSTPEPATWAMMPLGFAALGFAAYRASRKSAWVAAQESHQEKQRALA